jgi:phage terminase large subunit-like protein
MEAKIAARFEQMEAKIASRFEQMEAKIVSFSNELKLELGGRIDTLRWMLGVVVALNAAVFVQLFLKH